MLDRNRIRTEQADRVRDEKMIRTGSKELNLGRWQIQDMEIDRTRLTEAETERQVDRVTERQRDRITEMMHKLSDSG